MTLAEAIALGFACLHFCCAVMCGYSGWLAVRLRQRSWLALMVCLVLVQLASIHRLYDHWRAGAFDIG